MTIIPKIIEYRSDQYHIGIQYILSLIIFINGFFLVQFSLVTMKEIITYDLTLPKQNDLQDMWFAKSRTVGLMIQMMRNAFTKSDLRSAKVRIVMSFSTFPKFTWWISTYNIRWTWKSNFPYQKQIKRFVFWCVPMWLVHKAEDADHHGFWKNTCRFHRHNIFMMHQELLYDCWTTIDLTTRNFGQQINSFVMIESIVSNRKFIHKQTYKNFIMKSSQQLRSMRNDSRRIFFLRSTHPNLIDLHEDLFMKPTGL